MEDVARDCGISDDEAYNALEELVEWGSVIGPSKADQYNTYRAPRVSPGKRALKKAAAAGLPHPQPMSWAKPERWPTPRLSTNRSTVSSTGSLPFWKRSVILLAGIFMNLLFAMLVFVVVFSVIGFQVQHPETGEITTIHASVLQALQAGFMYIGMVIQAVVGLFNPATAAQTVSDSTSIVGIAVMSKDYFQAGLVEALEFMAMISVSLGIMNLLPIPPLDGGPLRGGNLPEGHPQDSVPEGHELYVAGRYGALPRLLRHHAEPGHPAVRLWKLGLACSDRLGG